LFAAGHAQMPHNLPLAESAPAAPVVQGPAEVLHPLTLQDCIQIALAQQPAVQAARASLAAALDRASAVENIRAPAFLVRDLPIRREQAATGVQGAQGGLIRQESEAVYGVTYCYLSVLYADEQLRLADAVRKNLETLKEAVPELTKKWRNVLLKEHLEYVNAYLHTLDGRRQAAVFGRKRAMAALREAMGIGPGCELVLAATALPAPEVSPCLADIVALAEARRGEVLQAQVAVQATQMEIAAQGARCRSRVATFASGSDIHGTIVPPGDLAGLRYEPRGVPPEMPAYLVGSRAERQDQAADYAHRAEAMASKTHGLVALDAEDAFYLWQEKHQKAQDMRQAYKSARTFSEAVRSTFERFRTEAEPPEYPHLDTVIQAGLTTTQLEVEWEESHYQYLLALAALQRATAGGFCVDFDNAPRLEQPKPNNGKKNGR
jgi:outer membrane protein TolC